MYKKENGITLIALVITIIVLLILAGVTIATLTGDNGLLSKTMQANKMNEDAEIKEIIQTELIASYDETGKYEISTVKDNFRKSLGIEITDNGDGTFGGEYKGVHFEVYRNQSVRIGNKLKTGDYFEYNISYQDMKTDVEYDKNNGWRVLSVSPEDGSLKIISTGIPARIYINNVEENNSWWGTQEDIIKEYANISQSARKTYDIWIKIQL